MLVLAAAAAFVWVTSGDLPPVVASHFGPGGVANGFMARGAYTALMLALVVAVPALVAWSTLLLGVLPTKLINLPHRQYWLAPQRRAATLEALTALSLRFAFVLVVFLCFVHWLVVRANAVRPATLPETQLFVGLAVFAMATLLWLFILFRRFGRLP